MCFNWRDCLTFQNSELHLEAPMQPLSSYNLPITLQSNKHPAQCAPQKKGLLNTTEVITGRWFFKMKKSKKLSERQTKLFFQTHQAVISCILSPWIWGMMVLFLAVTMGELILININLHHQSEMPCSLGDIVFR